MPKILTKKTAQNATRVLVVEDEAIVASDIQNSLSRLGYTVPGIAADGGQALKAAQSMNPDIVLMDIRLKKGPDGISTAQKIREGLSIPVVYLTAYADDSTLKRARKTEPYGYILKPFAEGDLKAGIEMALYKHASELKLKEHSHWVSRALACIDSPMIVADPSGRVKFLNEAAQTLFGQGPLESKDGSATQALRVGDLIEQETQVSLKPWGFDSHLSVRSSVRIKKKGRKVSYQCTTIPLRKRERVEGAVLVLEALDPSRQSKGPSMPSRRVSQDGASAEASPLTSREQEILSHMGQGQRAKEIAEYLELSTATVRTHIQHILKKLNAHTKLEAVMTAIRRGWFSG